MKHWRILSYFFFTPLFRHVSIALTIINTISACLFDCRVGRINLETFHPGPNSGFSGHSGTLMLFSRSVSDSMSAAYSSSLLIGYSESPLQLSQTSASEMHSGGLSLSLSAGWQLILQIQRTLIICVHPPARFFADKGHVEGDHSDDWNATAPSCWNTDHNALKIPSMSEMYPMAVLCLFRARDSFCVAHSLWLPCHIPHKSWTSAILCNVVCSTSFLISESFSVPVVSNSGSAPAKIPLLGWAHSLSMTCWQRVSPLVFDCLQPITSRPREKLASTWTQCGIIDDMSCITMQRSAYFECLSSCWRHQSVISSNQHVLRISIGSEW